jgi:hypothetical protein
VLGRDQRQDGGNDDARAYSADRESRRHASRQKLNV